MTTQPLRILTGPELRALSRRSNRSGALRLAAHLLLLTIAAVLVVRAGPWTLLPAMLVLGILQAALFAPVHETMHLTAFASRRANQIAGWLAACPSLLNWHFYTAFHLAHHRHTQDPARDPELTALPTPKTLNAYLWRTCAFPYWHTRLTVLRDAWSGNLTPYPFITQDAAPRIIRSIRLMTLFVAACTALSIALIGWYAPLIFWLGPQLLGQPFLRLYLLTEHTACTLDSNGLTNTRTTLTNRFMHALMWNMSYHAEHHLYPSIPFHRLAEAHQVIGHRLGVIQPGYTSWHLNFIRSLQA